MTEGRLPIQLIIHKSILIGLLLLLPLGAVAAELPLLGAAATSTGSDTTAIFRAGATTGDSGFHNDFLPAEAITIAARIEVESAHVNQIGNLFALFGLDENFFMHDSAGNYHPWNGNPVDLLATSANAPLAASTQLTLLDGIALGSLGLAGSELRLYLAYNLSSAPARIYYSDTPLQIRIARYDPLQVTASATQSITFTMLDSARNREIPLLVFLPESPAPAPVILFSHGLGGTYETAVYLGEHWSARGYVAVFMQHPGSDATILEGVPASQILSVMQAAASAGNLVARIDDVSAIIDQLEIWNADSSHALGLRLDLNHIGMSGHSFGARTTQITSGEIVPWISTPTRDPRIKAAMPLSASVTSITTASALLGAVDIPWLIMTGTLDESVINDTTVAERLAVFPALPPGNKYELVLFEGEHHAFTDRPVSALQNPRNPAHHPAIKAISTAFWDSYLRGDVSARQWLENTARSVLSSGDSWQLK